MNILLIEDDHNLAKAVIEYLEFENINCDYADNGVTGLKLLQNNFYQVLVLDINMPRMDGLSVCNALRTDGNDIPVLMLTAKDRLEDKLAGFKVGTDDYLVKPFAMDELVVRIKALSGRVSRQLSKLHVGDLEFDTNLNSAKRGSTALSLSPTSLRLLEKMMRASPKAVSKEELVDYAWGEDGTDFNTLQVHIHKLRRGITPNGEKQLIQTVKAYGYVISDNHED